MYSGDENSNSQDEFETVEEVEENEDDEGPEYSGNPRDRQGLTEMDRQQIADAGRGHLLW